MNSIICDNCYKVFLKRLNYLPNELKNIIFKFIPVIKLVNLNHYYYKTYHYYITCNIQSRNYQNYITDMIRKDNSLAFYNILNDIQSIENDFTRRKTYVYKKKIINICMIIYYFYVKIMNLIIVKIYLLLNKI